MSFNMREGRGVYLRLISDVGNDFLYMSRNQGLLGKSTGTVDKYTDALGFQKVREVWYTTGVGSKGLYSQFSTGL